MGGAIFKSREGEGGGTIFVDGDGIEPCSCCGVVAEYLCDFPLGKGKTCDARLCEDHAILQGRRPSNQLTLFQDEPAGMDDDDALHFCPTHDLIARKRRTTDH